ncbi:MAG: hypothetical protein IT371_17895 [Deltaproteobacteria bacterium]|nr:hypothetical protein [Deltaproteobacteria bacterium]
MSSFTYLHHCVYPYLEPRERIEAVRPLCRPEDHPVWHPLVDDLGVVYVLHEGEQRTTLRVRDLERLGVADPVLRLLAQENLAQFDAVAEAQIMNEAGGPLLLFHHPQLPVAAALDNAAFRQSLKALLAGPALVSVPRRNVILALGLHNEEGLETFLSETQKLYALASHPLWPTAIVVDGANLSPFGPVSGGGGAKAESGLITLAA